MTESNRLNCSTCSRQFDDLKSLLNHMLEHTATTSTAPLSKSALLTCKSTATSEGTTVCDKQQRQIVLSQSAFRQLQPYLQQKNGPQVRVILSSSTKSVTRSSGHRSKQVSAPISHQSSTCNGQTATDSSIHKQKTTEEANSSSGTRAQKEQQPHIPVQDTHSCRICHRRFKHQVSLVAHCRQHAMSRTCGVCLLRVPSDAKLTEHLETHVDRRTSNFQCDQCDKSFVHAKSLYVHKRNHSGVRPYACQFCGKTFRHWHKRRVHERIHTGERPYVCHVCGWGFTRNDEKKRHMRTHQGCKPFHCSDCGVGCATQISLVNHINSHHCSKISSGGDGCVIGGSRQMTNGGKISGADAVDTIRSSQAQEKDYGELLSEPEDDVSQFYFEEDNIDGMNESGVHAETADDLPVFHCQSTSEMMSSETDFTEDQDNSQVYSSLPDSKIKRERTDDVAGLSTASITDDAQIESPVRVKTEPQDLDEGQWDDDSFPRCCKEEPEDADAQTIEPHLFEPNIQLTELAVDIVKIRDTIRNKLLENAHRFNEKITMEATEYVNDSEPDIVSIQCMLREKLRQGQDLSEMLDMTITEH